MTELETLGAVISAALVAIVIVAILLFSRLDQLRFYTSRHWPRVHGLVPPWLQAVQTEVRALLPLCSPAQHAAATQLLDHIGQYEAAAKDYLQAQLCGIILQETQRLFRGFPLDEFPALTPLREKRLDAEASMGEALPRYNIMAEKYAHTARKPLYRPFARLMHRKAFPPLRFSRQ